MKKLEIAEAIYAVSSGLRASGRRIVQTCDFESIASELAENGKALNRDSDPYISDLTDADTFYIVVRGPKTEGKPDGSLDGFCCIRLYNLGPEALPQHLARRYRRIYGGGSPAIDPESLPDEAKSITGRVVCISDVFVEPRSRGALVHRVSSLRSSLPGDLTSP